MPGRAICSPTAFIEVSPGCIAEAPTASYPLYPADESCADKPKANWRCKECHGWDYEGVDSASYKSGKHSPGISGINGSTGRDLGEMVALPKDKKPFARQMGNPWEVISCTKPSTPPDGDVPARFAP